MPKKRENKKLLKLLNSTLDDSEINLQQLLDEHFFNFQFEDTYGFAYYPNKGLIRKRIIQLLFEIHDLWKIELDKLNKPYYLAIWLNEPDIILSEVVCAIEERIEMYSEKWFDDSEKSNIIKKEAYGKSQHHFERFNWQRKKSYITHDNSDYNRPKEGYNKIEDYYKEKRFYRKTLTKCKKVEEGLYGKIYYQEVGDLWVGIEK